ncbi:UNVERIFIED_CONTAM: hypothetical protein GTU68_024344 [Idotea baltica]|nr:hypothetical protein [Idotea baltica]
MRRIMQGSGAEIIHLGHNRSVQEIVNAAIQEDVQAIAITSYQGGHVEYFKYMYDLLQERGAKHIKIFGGGGGTILPSELDELHAHGIAKIYSPDDGRKMGLQGMINDLLQQSDYALPSKKDINPKSLIAEQHQSIARLISMAENEFDQHQELFKNIDDIAAQQAIPVLGITGTGGAGKSSVVDELVRRFISDFPEKNIAIISVDPSKRKTGGALLGDRIRMNSIHHPTVYMRSLATRQSNLSLSKHIVEALHILKVASFDFIILETSGIGQSDTEIADFADVSLYVMTPEFGAATQLEKIDMLDFADVVAINKFDKRGAQDALRDVKKQFQRNHQFWDKDVNDMPIYGTIASQFNDPGIIQLYKALLLAMNEKLGLQWQSKIETPKDSSQKIHIIPPARVRYLSEIAENNRRYDEWAESQSAIADELDALEKAKLLLNKDQNKSSEINSLFDQSIGKSKQQLTRENRELLDGWEDLKAKYKAPIFEFKVRQKTIEIQTHTESLSHSKIPKVALPNYNSKGDILKWRLQENVPGYFPFTAGVFPFKREGEDPTRMFAGEGGPERTNKRFHYLSLNHSAKRLSTAFDSVTLYGEDPDHRPDIYGKIGNSGVSICCLDDAKKLYSGFDLCNPSTSVSMTINGPAAIVTGFFMNAAIDQQCELHIKENGLEASVKQKIKIKATALSKVRGTVQADILKEDQAQNTCIFSTEFSLKLMGDMQAYFIEQHIRNFYSVSISGYHIAEAGSNPISQLAFTLSNGFTFVEYYLSRGMNIDDFAPNLSFFFSNGIDPEYAVIGRVARRIWAKAMKLKYNANERSQKLKYHIQTSGRSLHAQEIDFNDIRTTLQALYAIYDNCNSLHTNAYDEAITTPTEDSVRRAVAIQLIINKELGLAKNENPLQGSFIIEELTDLVEEAVLLEFDKITERGGVLGAMETMYQRSKIQEESIYYETLKHTGEYPIIGVNTFLSSKGSPTIIPDEVIRSTAAEKELQIDNLKNLHLAQKDETAGQLEKLQAATIQNKNIFEALMECSKFASLGQITNALYKVGGQYRRNM